MYRLMSSVTDGKFHSGSSVKSHKHNVC